MYSKFDKFVSARYVFEQMSQRNDASWSTMFSGYVRGGVYPEAVELFREMWWVQGIAPNGFLLASLVTICSRWSESSMVFQGNQVHGFVVKFGFLSDVFVSTALLHFYATYGIMLSLRRLFEEMGEKNVVTWTSLMVGYSSNGDPEEAVNVYCRMRREGVACNQNSFATVISSCGLLEDQLLCHQVLANAVVSGFELSISVSNSIISMFGGFGCVEEASRVFNRMEERDIISWNSMISAYSRNELCQESFRCFHYMRHSKVKPDSTTLSSLVSACCSGDNLNGGGGVHGLVAKIGLDSNVCVCNALISFYADAGKCKDAELLFREIPEKDLISWNSMMSSYVQNGKYQVALKLFIGLLGTSKIRNHVTFASALAACSARESLNEGKLVHALIIQAGLHKNLVVRNALVTMYGKCGIMREAKRIFQMMYERDRVTWNALIGGYTENEEPKEAINTFILMRQDGMTVNYISVINVLGSCLIPENLQKYGRPIHGYTVLSGLERDSYVQNSLLTMYAKCGDLDSSKFIFDGLANKNVVSWNAIIAANAHHGSGEEALKYVLEMHRTGLEFDQFSFSGGLAASSSLGLLQEGQQLHNMVIKLGFESDLHVINAAMDMYGKCGEMLDVLQILPTPKDRSRLSWNILISGFSRHGGFQEARETFHQMLEEGPTPDHVTFVSLLSACNHGGLVDEGLAYFSLMNTDFGVSPEIEHCVCIVDLLGRKGRFIDAENFIKEMPVAPNDVLWRSLLSACRTHNNLELGKKAAENLLGLDPSDDSAHVLLSNMCATNGRWEDVEIIRRKMKSIDITKKPACSWVKMKNKVSSFGIGDRSHPQVVQIYEKLEDIKKLIKQAGYVADTSFALHDTDEEQKEHNLWNHSERLALAFGLINTPEGLPLKIFKNLRVCGDCHSVYKFVSGYIGREIMLRDPYRFHHFSGGVCSCSDYW